MPESQARATTEACPPLDDLPMEDLRPTRARHLDKGPFPLVAYLIRTFSCVEKRDPPSKDKTFHARLVTIGISHFCEKARWGLDLLEADDVSDHDDDCPFYYTEDGHPPALVSFQTIAASKDVASATPMLIFDNGDFIYKSGVILQQMCPFLYPKEIESEIKDFEAHLGTRLGAPIRCAAYHYFLQPEYQHVLKRIGSCDTSKIEGFLFHKLLDKMVPGFRKKMDITNESCETSLQSIRKVFGEVSERLQQNGGYLMDTSTKLFGFTAADLTFAALGALVVLPPEMSRYHCLPEELPPAMQSLREELMPTPAGQHVLLMYKLHRFGIKTQPIISEETRLVKIKTAKRNRVPWLGLVLSIGTIIAAVVVYLFYSRN